MYVLSIPTDIVFGLEMAANHTCGVTLLARLGRLTYMMGFSRSGVCVALHGVG